MQPAPWKLPYLAGIIGLAVALGVAGIWAYPRYAQQQRHKADLLIGAAIYAENCASCHGVNLEGEANWQSPNPDGTLPAPPHNEDGHTWHHSDRLLFNYTKLGGKGAMAQQGLLDFNSAMPAFGADLSDREINAVLAYIKSRWPEDIQSIQHERSR